VRAPECVRSIKRSGRTPFSSERARLQFGRGHDAGARGTDAEKSSTALIAPRIGARIRLFVFDGEADALKLGIRLAALCVRDRLRWALMADGCGNA
jgi:hypothetical protein